MCLDLPFKLCISRIRYLTKTVKSGKEIANIFRFLRTSALKIFSSASRRQIATK